MTAPQRPSPRIDEKKPRDASRPRPPLEAVLSRRERQIMDVLFRQSEATVAEVLAELPDPPSYSAVRALLRVLEEKGQIAHRQDGPRYVYRPTAPAGEASETALRRVLRTFFGGSATRAVAALIDLEADNLTDDDLADLAAVVAEARSRETEETPR